MSRDKGIEGSLTTHGHHFAFLCRGFWWHAQLYRGRGYRRELYAQKSILLKTIVCSLLGGMLGAFLLLNTSESDFLKAIPWLLLFATILFVFGGRINQAIGHHSSTQGWALSR